MSDQFSHEEENKNERSVTMQKMFSISVVCFLLGVGYTWFITEKYNGDVLKLWTQAYTVGKDDGYKLGRADVTLYDKKFTFTEKESLCLFLYADKGTVFGTKRK